MAIIFNMTVLVRIMNTVRNSDVQFKHHRNKTISKDHYHDTRIKMTRIALTCTCIMGISWVIGIFALGDASTAVQWVYTVLNSLQGFFIFVFHTARNKDIKKEIEIRMIKFCPSGSRLKNSSNFHHNQTFSMELKR